MSLYLIDAIAREARARAKKALKEKGAQAAQADDEEPEEGKDATGTPATFLAKVEGVLAKIVLDCWENGLREHRVSPPSTALGFPVAAGFGMHVGHCAWIECSVGVQL